MKCEFLTVFPWKMIGNLHVLVGKSNDLVSRRERDVTLAWRRQSGHRKSGPDYSARSHVLNCCVLLNHSNSTPVPIIKEISIFKTSRHLFAAIRPVYVL